MSSADNLLRSCFDLGRDNAVSKSLWKFLDRLAEVRSNFHQELNSNVGYNGACAIGNVRYTSHVTFYELFEYFSILGSGGNL